MGREYGEKKEQKENDARTDNQWAEMVFVYNSPKGPVCRDTQIITSKEKRQAWKLSD